MRWLLPRTTVVSRFRRPAPKNVYTRLESNSRKGNALTDDRKELYELRLERHTLHCKLAGRLGATECEQIAETLAEPLADQPKSVVFDLAKAEFVFSSFLRVCVSIAKRLNGGRLSITNASPPIKEVLTTAGFDRMPEINVE